ncbi:MAG: helix-turn-helix domain-containing protein [Gemmataceae bacterium]|nr:helix-turn-helix domain-containing protein [Gemmataceae bacterium]MCI0738686.1 helix-turn-helix domain-containing protein [Gemmataceae bacterium]
MATYGVKDLCEFFAVGEHTVLGWIAAGELRAIDVSRKQSGRPKWRITQAALEAFEALRAASPPAPPPPRRRRQAEVIEFIK